MQFPNNYVQKGSGPPFVFQHGLGANIEQTQKLFATLKHVEFISMDCPGHGQSPLEANTFPSFDYYADQLIALLDHLNVSKATFGGISMGAGIALNVALRFPERVQALVLVRPAWVDLSTPNNLTILLEAAKNIRVENGAMAFSQSQYFRQIKTILPTAAESLLSLFDRSQREELPLVLEKMVEDRPFSNISELQEIQVPCMIVGNEKDPLHPFEMASQLHQNIKQSELHKVVSRYVDETEHAVAVNQLVSTFITTYEKQLEGY